MSVHLLAGARAVQRGCVLLAYMLVYVCAYTVCPGVCVSQWPAASHRPYLWVKLAQIHLLKSAFYSVSHKQIPAGFIHFQKHSITSSDLSPTSVDVHFCFFFSPRRFM